jgi:hypothetical protein
MTLVICLKKSGERPESRTNGPRAPIIKAESSVPQNDRPGRSSARANRAQPNEVTTGKKTKNGKREGGQS